MTTKIISAAALAIAFIAGWKTSSWHHDSQRLVAERAAQQVADKALLRESQIADIVEQRLANLHANERVIDRGVIREIQKPVYQRLCLEPDAIRLLNHAAQYTGADPAKSAAPLP
ncbi:hypothetical protein [Carnimonas bestiolae]|uniref:hypothetical protein n=1 Tax=Carnimonas bestiolae TaxID=3402172 RepID=UPI003EDBA9EF